MAKYQAWKRNEPNIYLHDLLEYKLINAISKLPGLGPRSAKRIVLKLINNLLQELGSYMIAQR